MFNIRRSEYIETREGQAYEKFKRSLDIFYFRIAQEPKSKRGISIEEAKEFRVQIKKFLKEQKRRAFRGDIILEIDFQTTHDNPPAIQNLTKNYLDLLHKPMKEVDPFKGILFKDDSQIKTLIANYHLNNSGNYKSEIRIKAYRYSHFLKDIELADRIRNDRFEDGSSLFHGFSSYDGFEEDTRNISYDYFDDLKELEENKDWYISRFDISFYNIQKQYLQRRIQENYLQQNNISNNDLISLFQSSFSYNTKYSSHKEFQEIWQLATNLISVSASLIELGEAPSQKGDTKKFKTKLEKKLFEFKSKYKVLFPLLQPLSITIFYTPPIENVLDLDNLAKYIIPLLTKIFEPPSSLCLTYDPKYLNDSLKREALFSQKIPKNGIASYQIIHISRTKDSPDEGIINFYITDGVFMDNNIWYSIDKFISGWEG